jgi:hypothetical protein
MSLLCHPSTMAGRALDVLPQHRYQHGMNSALLHVVGDSREDDTRQDTFFSPTVTCVTAVTDAVHC